MLWMRIVNMPHLCLWMFPQFQQKRYRQEDKGEETKEKKIHVHLIFTSVVNVSNRKRKDKVSLIGSISLSSLSLFLSEEKSGGRDLAK